MKPTLLYALLTLLPGALLAADSITIEAKFIESSHKTIPHDLAKLANVKGFDLLSSPRVNTRPNRQAQIEVVREVRPASVAPSSFEPVSIGITVRVTPHFKGDRIAYTAQLTVRELVTNKSQGEQTITEITSRDLYVSGVPKDGEEVWFDFIQPHNGKKILVWLRFKREAA